MKRTRPIPQKSNPAKPDTTAKLTPARRKQGVRTKYSMYAFQGPDPFLMIFTNV
ncbi:MAG TPA: hypothetical protein VMJ12_03430 [Candidatus Acidoferrales bacterium]|nr:hypothetical protein [Candidatus Acidoferrales bacterium]